ncbi:MAG: hypothetical protein CR217_13400 [Beijerinckiaceae bacterium]|nr:MAG: hypothetical protein CR217_13400 [Beijerinckiaceae bacterium]
MKQDDGDIPEGAHWMVQMDQKMVQMDRRSRQLFQRYLLAALLVATGIVIAALLVATPATDLQPSTGPLSIAELIEPKKVKTVSYPLPVPQTGPYGAPAVTRTYRFSAPPAAEAKAKNHEAQ